MNKEIRGKRGVFVFTPCLTSGVPAKDEFSDLVVNEDEEAVGERTEPPAGPEREQEPRSEQEISHFPVNCSFFMSKKKKL